MLNYLLSLICYTSSILLGYETYLFFDRKQKKGLIDLIFAHEESVVIEESDESEESEEGEESEEIEER